MVFKPCCLGHCCPSTPLVLGALSRCCRHNPPHHWDIHPWQNSFQEPFVATLSWGPRGKDAGTRCSSKPTQKRGLQV